MSSDTDHPRQRTVAELLAEHGDAGATGRRRRRREADRQDDGPTPPPVGNTQAGPEWRPVPPEPDRAVPDRVTPDPPSDGPGWSRHAPRTRAGPHEVPRTDVPQQEVPQARVYAPDRPAPSGSPGQPVQRGPEREQPSAALPLPVRPAPDPRRERPTDVMPRIRDAAPGALDPGLTGPIRQQPAEPDAAGQEPGPDGVSHDEQEATREGGVDADDPNAGPATMIGAAPVGAEAWHRGRTDGRPGARGEAAAAPAFDDHPAGLGGVDVEHEDIADLADLDDDREPGGGPDGAGSAGAARRAERPSTASAGQAWAAVLAQWIAGAVGGAALWVGFRFLWRELPVVALAAAVLVTVGLVVVVRALLRNDDLRTTLFAVLVGLLLTVSPAILVLLGR